MALNSIADHKDTVALTLLQSPQMDNRNYSGYCLLVRLIALIQERVLYQFL